MVCPDYLEFHENPWRYLDLREGPCAQAGNDMLKIMFFGVLSRALTSAKMIKCDFVGQLPIVTERLCSVMVKQLIFKIIQIELLYSFRAKFLTPAKYK